MNEMTKYLLHLDQLRIESKTSIESFTENTCSPRQYSRYLNGSSTITQGKFTKLLQKLNISSNEFYISFHSTNDNEFKYVKEMYHQILNNNYFRVKEINKILGNTTFSTAEVKKFYQFNSILYMYKTNQINELSALDKFSKLIDYKTFDEKSFITFIDLLCLIEIASIEKKIKKEKALKYLHDLLTERNRIYLSSNTRYFLPPLFFRISKIYGIDGDIDKSIQIAAEGLKYSIKTNDMSSLEHLYYLLSLGYLKKGDFSTAQTYKKKCLYVCEVKNDKKSLNNFRSIFEKDFEKYQK
jgi:tetratricopeptide (TPR) repeat protein